MIIGRYKAGTTPTTLAADTKTVVTYAFKAGQRIPKLTLLVDGLGTGAVTATWQAIRGVVYDSSDRLLGVGDEVAVLAHQALGWIDLPFFDTPGGVLLPLDGGYRIGYHAGPSSNVIRVYS